MIINMGWRDVCVLQRDNQTQLTHTHTHTGIPPNTCYAIDVSNWLKSVPSGHWIDPMGNSDGIPFVKLDLWFCSTLFQYEWRGFTTPHGSIHTFTTSYCTHPHEAITVCSSPLCMTCVTDIRPQTLVLWTRCLLGFCHNVERIIVWFNLV